MSGQQDSGFAPVRYENGTSFIIAGFGQRYTLETNNGIPDLWEKFGPYIGKVPEQQGGETYGVCCNPDGRGSFEYIARFAPITYSSWVCLGKLAAQALTQDDSTRPQACRCSVIRAMDRASHGRYCAER